MLLTGKSPNVMYRRQDVVQMSEKWDIIRDCIAGQSAIKKGKTKYLPMPNPTDQSPENVGRYEQYLKRAVFYNVTARTMMGLVGEVFSKDLNIDLPDAFKNVINNVDGAGVTLEQQSKKALGEVISYGRVGLFIDYPNTGAKTTVQQQVEGSIRPTILTYLPWDIINWRVRQVGARLLLSLVVIQESQIFDDDGFEAQYTKRYRILKLDDDGIYKVGIYAEGSTSDIQWVTPTDSNGNPLHEIPFIFIGSTNNDSHMDLPPLYDLAVLNVGHFCNSADYEESCFMVGQPTPYFSGLTKMWVDEIYKGTVFLGSRSAILLPEGGGAGLLQAQANIMPKEAMEAKERQMVALGAKLTEQKGVQRTATEAQQDESTEISILSACAKNVSDAYTTALHWCSIFSGISMEGFSFKLNRDFLLSQMSAQERLQLMTEWQAGAITWKEYRYSLKRSDIAFENDDFAREQIKEEFDQTLLKMDAESEVAEKAAMAAAEVASAAQDVSDKQLDRKMAATKDSPQRNGIGDDKKKAK